MTVTQLRLLTGDPSGTSEKLSDSEYEAIIELEDNIYRAAAVACRSIAGLLADRVDMSTSTSSLKLSSQSSRYLELAKSYDLKANAASNLVVGLPVLTGVSVSEVDAVEEDSDRVPSAFAKDEFDSEAYS